MTDEEAERLIEADRAARPIIKRVEEVLAGGCADRLRNKCCGCCEKSGRCYLYGNIRSVGRAIVRYFEEEANA
jgi:hypothetical protein